MIKVKLVIFKATAQQIVTAVNNSKPQTTVSEEACRSIVNNFKGPLPVSIGKVPIGLVAGLEYDEKTQTVIADIELYLVGVAGFDPDSIKFLDTPAGRRLVGGNLSTVDLQLTQDFQNKKGDK